ncbi:MAG: hypothetical protein QM723_24360 [Myxococcaceae bacterium]
MNKIDSSGAQLMPNDDSSTPPSTGPTLKDVRDVGDAAVSVVEKSIAWMVPFNPEEVHATFSDAANYVTHNDGDIQKAFQQMRSDPKKAFNSMNQSEASWLVSSGFSDDQRKSVVNSLVTSGLTKKVDGQAVPAGAPKPPALFEVNDRQPPSMQQLLHETNVKAARDYDSAYDAYAGKTNNPAPYVNLAEPGSGASLEEDMSMRLAGSVGEYATGKLDDAKNALSVSKQARKLSPGDEMQIQFGFDGVAAGKGISTGATLKVKRESDGYRVSPQGSFGFGGKLDDDNKSSVTGSWGGEYHCKTLNDVDRLSGLMKDQALGRQLSLDDQRFLNEHCSGLDLKGSAALKLAAKMNDDLKLGAGLKSDASVHIDLEARTVTVSEKFAADSSAQLNSKEGSIPGKPNWKTTSTFDAGLSGDMTVSVKYSLPADFSMKSLGTDLSAMRQTGETSVKMHLQNGTSSAKAVDVEAKPKDVDLKAVLASWAQGDSQAAFKKLAGSGTLTIKTDSLTSANHDLSPKIGTSADSISIGFKSQRIHHDQKEVRSLSEALDFLKS